MLNTIVIAENTFDASEWQTFEVEDICAFLAERYESFPSTARIYHDQVSQDNDVTPSDVEGIKKLQGLSGNFYLMVYPADPTTIIVSVLALAAAAAAAFLLMPATPVIAESRNQQSPSPNNELSNRTNKPRVNGRIPDILGTVVSVPDLISVPLKYFNNNVELERSNFCLGRGEYEIGFVRDDKTAIEILDGSGVAVWGPYSSPNNGNPPINQIGSINIEPIKTVSRSNSVNGQVLGSPNANAIIGRSSIRFVKGGYIQLATLDDYDFRDYYSAGDPIAIDNSISSDGVYSLGFNGGYFIQSVSAGEILLSNPESVNLDWGKLPLFRQGAGVTEYLSAVLTLNKANWVGPFILDDANLDEIVINLVAPNGLFKDDGNIQYNLNVVFQISLTPVDELDNPRGVAEQFEATMTGSASLRSTRAKTIFLNPTFRGRCSVQIRRMTTTDYNFEGSIVDEIRWRDLYSQSPTNKSDFGNVTILQAVTEATAGALSVKERRLNLKATRKIPKRISGSSFTEELYATNRIDDIISFACIDPFIGNRSLFEVDFDSIYDTVQEIVDYFGTEVAVEFGYTFDVSNSSFEETISSIVSSIFCVAYRRGNIIKISFEKRTEDSTLLFNHANKIPGSETRTLRFGPQDDVDGVEIEYVSSFDGAILTYHLPIDRSAINPKNIKTIGIQQRLMAYFHAHRAYNKIRYQNTTVDFEATQEADLLVLRDRILVTDNTRTKSQDGEIEEQNGLQVQLSQPFPDEPGPLTIYLQLPDGTVEAMPVTGVQSEYSAILQRAPRIPLVTANENFARTNYSIVSANSRRTSPFLLIEKNPQTSFTTQVTAINYDDRYYANDDDYINGSVSSDGTPLGQSGNADSSNISADTLTIKADSTNG